ncbi:MAG TPA: hypothetical protein VF556_14065 [Pyrinomonadaceae bacterium]
MAQAPARTNEIKTGIITLYARDPLAQSFCFRDGDFGSVFYENEVRNRCSDINFNGYRQKDEADIFKIAVEGRRQGVIFDLGTTDELQKKYGYEETVGKGQGFASLQVRDGKVYVLKDRRARTTQELSEPTLLFQKPSSETETVSVKLGHIYLMRLTDRSEKAFERIVKLLVIAHVPNESVTIRWQSCRQQAG